MKKIITGFLIIIMVTPVFITADSTTHTIKGSIKFPKNGSIYIMLLTEKQYQEKMGKSTSFRSIFTIGPEELKSQIISFTISDIPPGIYCLTCFQDLNDNGQLDKGLFGPVEPWAIYKPPQGGLGRPDFKDICFTVDHDITNIMIELK